MDENLIFLCSKLTKWIGYKLFTLIMQLQHNMNSNLLNILQLNITSLSSLRHFLNQYHNLKECLRSSNNIHPWDSWYNCHSRNIIVILLNTKCTWIVTCCGERPKFNSKFINNTTWPNNNKILMNLDIVYGIKHIQDNCGKDF